MISEAKENYDRLAGVSSGQAHRPCCAKTRLSWPERLLFQCYSVPRRYIETLPATFCPNIL